MIESRLQNDWTWSAGFRPWAPWRGSARRKEATLPVFEAEERRRLSHLRPRRSSDAIQTFLQRSHQPKFVKTSEVHFYRACSVHLDEVKPDPNNGEILVCPHGHRTNTWVTMCSDGRVIGQAWKDRTAMIVGKRAIRAKEKKSE